MQSRGAGVVVDAGSTQVFDPQMDITNTVIQQLDQGTRTATVARHSVTECQQQTGRRPGGGPALKVGS